MTKWEIHSWDWLIGIFVIIRSECLLLVHGFPMSATCWWVYTRFPGGSGKHDGGCSFDIITDSVSVKRVTGFDIPLCCFWCGQNVRFSNGYRRIRLHRKISNVCIDDRVLCNEMWWFRMTMNMFLVLQSCCPPRCYRILGGCSNVCYVVVGPIRLNEMAGCPSRIVILSYFVILLFDPSK